MLNRRRTYRGRYGLALVLAIAAATGVAACGSGSGSTSAPASSSLNLKNLSGTLDIMGFGTNGDDVASTRYKLAQAAMPKVKVSAPNGGFADQSFLAAESSGNPPDLIYMTSGDLGTYAAKGALIPLTSCIKSAGINMSTFTPGAQQEVTYGGTVYGPGPGSARPASRPATGTRSCRRPRSSPASAGGSSRRSASTPRSTRSSRCGPRPTAAPSSARTGGRPS
jgi:hypothetical protein